MFFTSQVLFIYRLFKLKTKVQNKKPEKSHRKCKKWNQLAKVTIKEKILIPSKRCLLEPATFFSLINFSISARSNGFLSVFTRSSLIWLSDAVFIGKKGFYHNKWKHLINKIGIFFTPNASTEDLGYLRSFKIPSYFRIWMWYLPYLQDNYNKKIRIQLALPFHWRSSIATDF